MKALPAARFSASYVGFCNPIQADSCALVSLHLRSTYAEVADTFSGAIARWSRRTVRAPVSAVLQAFGAISSMVSPSVLPIGRWEDGARLNEVETSMSEWSIRSTSKASQARP